MAKKPITEENRAIARHARDVFGGTARAFEYLHDTRPLAIAMVSAADQPHDGLTSYATVGLSDSPMLTRDGKEFSARIELCGICHSEHPKFANVIASAAFFVMRHNRLCCP